MKYLLIISALFVFGGCSAVPEEASYGYRPDYEGRYVNSVEKLQGWYTLNKNTFQKSTLIEKGGVYGG